MFAVLFVLSLWLARAPAWGAPAVGHAAWDVRDGLPLNGISSVILGPDGYLWVATFGGVVRFDGVSFRPIAPSEGPGWPSTRAVELRASPDGRVWVLLEQGWVVAVDPATDALRVFEGEQLKIGPDGAVWTVHDGAVRRLGWDGAVAFDPPALAGQRVIDVEPGPDGGLWTVSADAVVLVPADGTSRAWSVASLEIGAPVRLLRGEDGEIWVTGDRALAHLPETAAEAPFVLHVDGAPWGAEAVGVAPEPDGAWLVGTEHNLSLWRDGQATPLLDDRPGRPPFRFRVTGSDGARWVATRNAVLRDGAAVFRTDPGDGVIAIAPDADGALWVGIRRPASAPRRAGLHHAP